MSAWHYGLAHNEVLSHSHGPVSQRLEERRMGVEQLLQLCQRCKTATEPFSWPAKWEGNVHLRGNKEGNREEEERGHEAEMRATLQPPFTASLSFFISVPEKWIYLSISVVVFDSRMSG